jgi:hypothetical protein
MRFTMPTIGVTVDTQLEAAHIRGFMAPEASGLPVTKILSLKHGEYRCISILIDTSRFKYDL